MKRIEAAAAYSPAPAVSMDEPTYESDDAEYRAVAPVVQPKREVSDGVVSEVQRLASQMKAIQARKAAGETVDRETGEIVPLAAVLVPPKAAQPPALSPGDEAFLMSWNEEWDLLLEPTHPRRLRYEALTGEKLPI